MERNLYEFFINGKRWGDHEELISIYSTNAYLALTKLRILHGEDVYRRCYGCFENSENYLPLYSYCMYREQKIRDNGRKYFYNVMQKGGY